MAVRMSLTLCVSEWPIWLPFVTDWLPFRAYAETSPSPPDRRLKPNLLEMNEMVAPKTWERPFRRSRCLRAPYLRKSLLPSQTMGSYLRSATRSFIGISALSVILMCSGQTSVQHLVMLQ